MLTSHSARDCQKVFCDASFTNKNRLGSCKNCDVFITYDDVTLTSLFSVSYCTAWFNSDAENDDVDNESLRAHINNYVRNSDLLISFLRYDFVYQI